MKTANTFRRTLLSLVVLGLIFVILPVNASFGVQTGSREVKNVADYSSIQEAIDSLPPSGGTVYIPAGTYVISTPIKVPSNVVLLGDGFDTVLKLADEANCNVIENMHLGEWVDENIEIRNMQIDGNGETQTVRCNGVYLDTAPNSRVEHMWVHNFPRWTLSMGILIYRSPNAVVRWNVVEDNKYTGIMVQHSDSSLVSHNFLSRNHRGIYLPWTDDTRVQKNEMVNCDEGIRIYASSSNNKIVANYVEGSSEEGIVITHPECENNFIVGNRLVNNEVDIWDAGTNTKMPRKKVS